MRRGRSSRGERARERADNSAGDLMSGQVAGQDRSDLLEL